MGMGYRHAWRLVDSMNRNAPSPLVITQKGGKGGGGATLTEEGEAVVDLFDGFLKRFGELMDAESRLFCRKFKEISVD